MPSLAQISRVKYMFDKNTLMTIINALEFSKLFCCSSVLSNAATTHLPYASGCTVLRRPDHQQHQEVR